MAVEKIWKLREGIDADNVRQLSSELGVDPVLAELLVQRGVHTFEQARSFFRPSLDNLYDPFLMTDMDKAVERVHDAVVSGEKILVYGDYDVDGTTAVSLVYSFLRRLTRDVDFYIPERYDEGYGVSYKGIDWAKENGAAAPIQSNGNYSNDADSATFLATTANGGKVRNGNNALGVTLDYTDAQFASWSYNMFFYTGEPVILRDVANGMNATTFGMWVYIPEGAAGLAMQIQGTSMPDYSNNTGAHFYFTTASGAVKNLNSCTEADIPESRWVYATADLTAK